MQLRTGINGFTIVLICSLVPLVSLVPAVIPEDKITTDQRHFTTRIKILASVLEMQATALFKNFTTCSSFTGEATRWPLADSEAREKVRAIPECPAFDADCCALPAFFSALRALRGDMEAMCDTSSARALKATLNQLEATLNEGAAGSACQGKGLPPPDAPESGNARTAQRMSYIWWLLRKYDRFMRNTTHLYSPSRSRSA